jgi:cytochrome c oxidase cbb3-type subunit 3
MSSHFRRLERLAIPASLLGLTLALAGMEHARADPNQPAPPDATQPAGQAAPDGGVQNVPVTGLFPNGIKEPPLDQTGKQYEGNAQAIAIGSKLFDWYNCSGCHFHGAGGIGPAFDDSVWLYGGRIDQIYDSIYQGRPNGMPMWGKVLPSSAIWQIAAYVKSLETEAAKKPIPTEPVPAAPGPASLETDPQEGAPNP